MKNTAIRHEVDVLAQRAGGYRALAGFLGLTTQAVYAWGDKIPELRMYQLKVLKPEWLEKKPARKTR